MNSRYKYGAHSLLKSFYFLKREKKEKKVCEMWTKIMCVKEEVPICRLTLGIFNRFKYKEYTFPFFFLFFFWLASSQCRTYPMYILHVIFKVLEFLWYIEVKCSLVCKNKYIYIYIFQYTSVHATEVSLLYFLFLMFHVHFLRILFLALQYNKVQKIIDSGAAALCQ